jgi:hypothetical protein
MEVGREPQRMVEKGEKNRKERKRERGRKRTTANENQGLLYLSEGLNPGE